MDKNEIKDEIKDTNDDTVKVCDIHTSSRMLPTVDNVADFYSIVYCFHFTRLGRIGKGYRFAG